MATTSEYWTRVGGVVGVSIVLAFAIAVGRNIQQVATMEEHLRATDKDREQMRARLDVLDRETAAFNREAIELRRDIDRLEGSPVGWHSR